MLQISEDWLSFESKDWAVDTLTSKSLKIVQYVDKCIKCKYSLKIQSKNLCNSTEVK